MERDENHRSNMAEGQRHCDGCGKPPFVRQLDRDDDNSITYRITPLKSCSRCLEAFYHGVECQKRHYHLHKQTCRKKRNKEEQKKKTVYTIQQTLHTGRSLVASQDVNSGTTILEALPMVPPVLLESTRGTHCAVCFSCCSSRKDTHMFMMCTCSEECSKVSDCVGLVEEEKVIHRVLNEGRIPKIFPTALLVYRLMLHGGFVGDPTTVYNSTSDNKALLPNLNPNQILDMATQTNPTTTGGNHDGVDDSQQAHEHAILFTVLSLLNETPKLACPLDSMHLSIQIQQVLSCVKANAFSVTQNYGEVLGTALFPAPACLVNHACHPNTLQLFALRKGQFPCLSLLSNQLIQANQDITISYLDLPFHWSTQQRRERIQQLYHFDCHCSSCGLV